MLQEKGIDARVLEHDLHSWRDTGRPLVVGFQPYASASPSPAAQ
jgi:hypothetical protein